MNVWPSHVFGLDSASGPWYLLWSGFGGRIPLGSAVLIAYLRRHNCHQPRCWRFGRHPHGHFMYCAVHHPHIPTVPEDS